AARGSPPTRQACTSPACPRRPRKLCGKASSAASRWLTSSGLYRYWSPCGRLSSTVWTSRSWFLPGSPWRASCSPWPSCPGGRGGERSNLRRKGNRVLSQDERSTLGLRERKKARTRAAIQRHAFRLFREHGYERTSVSQIAEAAEVSESTFFRYFPTKEDVVLWDAYDPRIIEAFRAQPAELSPVAALRAAFRDVLGQLSEAEQADQRERMELMLSV